MHYQDGEEVLLGDVVAGKDDTGRGFMGSVIATTPGADLCNVEVVIGGTPIRGGGAIILDGAVARTCTAKDLKLAMRADWLEPKVPATVEQWADQHVGQAAGSPAAADKENNEGDLRAPDAGGADGGVAQEATGAGEGSAGSVASESLTQQ